MTLSLLELLIAVKNQLGSITYKAEYLFKRGARTSIISNIKLAYAGAAALSSFQLATAVKQLILSKVNRHLSSTVVVNV